MLNARVAVLLTESGVLLVLLMDVVRSRVVPVVVVTSSGVLLPIDALNDKARVAVEVVLSFVVD